MEKLYLVEMLAKSCGAMGASVMMSTIEHKRVGIRCLVKGNLERVWELGSEVH